MEFDEPDRFATGTVGEAGERTFFLQAVQGERVSSVALEEAQVAILADRLIAILDELERRGLVAIDVGPATALDERPLEDPLEEEFVVGTLTIGLEEDLERVIIEARSETYDGGVGEAAAVAPLDDDEDDIPDDAPIGPDVLRVRLSPKMAQQFARRAERIVGTGRPACPFCGKPLEKTGHLCARRDGGEYLH